MYCQKRIKIKGLESQETYCMLELGHEERGEGPCQQARIVRDSPSYVEQAKEALKVPERKEWRPCSICDGPHTTDAHGTDSQNVHPWSR